LCSLSLLLGWENQIWNNFLFLEGKGHLWETIFWWTLIFFSGTLSCPSASVVVSSIFFAAFLNHFVLFNWVFPSLLKSGFCLAPPPPPAS
jgi:hypothetical protein